MMHHIVNLAIEATIQEQQGLFMIFIAISKLFLSAHFENIKYRSKGLGRKDMEGN